jgi:hypothetical protein
MNGSTGKAQLTVREATVGALVVTMALGVVSDLLFVAALQFRLDWLADPALLVAGGSASAELLKWATVADLFSYYLPTTVVALALWAALRSRRPILALGALLGALGYVFAGSIGAASLAMVGPPLIREYAQPGTQQAAVATAFGLLIEFVFRAVWQLVDGIFVAAWLIAIGILIRAEQPAFARLSGILGVLFLVSATFNVLGLGLARDATLGVAFAAWFAWDLWLAAVIWGRRAPFDDRTPWATRRVARRIRKRAVATSRLTPRPGGTSAVPSPVPLAPGAEVTPALQGHPAAEPEPSQLSPGST